MSVPDEEEYNQISEDWRHRDNLTWQIPSIIVVIGGGSLAAAFALNIDPQYLCIIRPILLGFGAFLSLCLTLALKANLWYQMGSGEALIKIVNGEGDKIPKNKVRRILKPEDFDIEICKKKLIKKHRLTGSNYLFKFCVFVTITLFGLLIWSIVECLMGVLSCLTFAS